MSNEPQAKVEKTIEEKVVETKPIEAFTQHPITKTHNIPMSFRETTIKRKLPLVNETNMERKVEIEVSNPSLVKLEQEIFSVPPKSKGFIKFEYHSNDSVNTTVYLLVKYNDVYAENYQLVFEYS